MPQPCTNSTRPTVTLLAATLFLLLPCLSFSTHTASAQTTTRNMGPNSIPVAGRFLEEWSKGGSEQANVYVNGYPITPRRPEISLEDGKLYDTQWFERARYEAHPENTAPYDVLLGRLGASLVEGRGGVDAGTGKARNPSDGAFVGIDKPSDADGKSRVWFPESRHTVSGKFLAYWGRYGGVKQFGFPLSEPLEETSSTDGKPYTVQYFERNRMELHPGKPAPYEVELGLLGVQQYGLQAVPADELPIAPPKGVTSSKDTLVQGSLQEPIHLIGFEDNASQPELEARFQDAITFNNGLVHGDDKGNYFPLAAWYVPTVENGGSYFVGVGGDRHLVTKYKLRPGVKWADGIEVTADDAVFAYNLLFADPHAIVSEQVKKLSNMDNPGKYIVVYNWLSSNEAQARLNDPTTNKRDYAFLNPFIEAGVPVTDKTYYAVGSVLPRHVLGNIAPAQITDSSYSRSPVGYGPYRVQEFTPGASLTLVANENYNLTAPPLLKKIVTKFNTDITTNVMNFRANELDAIAGDGFITLPEQSPQIIEADGKVDAVPASSWEHLEFHSSYAPFQDKRVRQAIMQAINRDQIVNIVYNNTIKTVQSARVLNGPTPPNVYFSLENPNFAVEFPDLAAKYKLPTYPYDPAAANRLLDDAGWMRGPDGIRQKNGQTLMFNFYTNRNATRRAEQALAGIDLKNVGIDVQVSLSACAYYCPPVTRQDRDQLVLYFSQQTLSSDYADYSAGAATGYPEYNNPEQNWFGYNSEKIAQANRAFKGALDRRSVAEAAAAAQVEVMNEVAVVPLVQRSNIEIYRNSLQNRKVTNSTAVSQWWNIGQWYFK